MSEARDARPTFDERGLPPNTPFNADEEVTPRELRDRLAAGEDIHLIDCRLPAERAITAIEPSELVPLQMLSAYYDDAVAPHRDETVVVYCRMGGRSLEFARFLKAKGFKNAKSLAGGINLWNADFGGGPIY